MNFFEIFCKCQIGNRHSEMRNIPDTTTYLFYLYVIKWYNNDFCEAYSCQYIYTCSTSNSYITELPRVDFYNSRLSRNNRMTRKAFTVSKCYVKFQGVPYMQYALLLSWRYSEFRVCSNFGIQIAHSTQIY